MKNYILLSGLILLFVGFSNASTYTPCTEDETATETCWPCGDTCSARLTYPSEEDALNKRNATLTFSGEGATYNFNTPSNNPELIGVEPWYNITNRIKNVVVEEGITHLGKRSIYDMHNLTNVSLPQSLESIGTYVFHYDTSLQSLVIPENVKTLHEYMLGDQTGLQELYCSENIKTLCDKVAANIQNQLGKEINVLSYQKDGDALFYNGKWYADSNDILTDNHIKKRIYTIEEAAKVSKEVGNSFKLRYK